MRKMVLSELWGRNEQQIFQQVETDQAQAMQARLIIRLQFEQLEGSQRIYRAMTF